MPEIHPLHKEGTVVNRRQSHGRPRLIGVLGERRLARVVRSNRRATVAQIDQEVNVGSDGKVSEYTVHHSLLCMGLHSCRPVRVPMLTPLHLRKHHVSIRTGPWSNGRRWPGLMNHVFFYITWMAGEHKVPGCTMGRRQAVKPWVLPTMWMFPT